MKNQRTKIMVECALMVALAAILSRIQFAPWPQGGSITLAAMTPIVFVALRRGWKWGLLTAFTYSLLQMLLDGISAPPVQSVFWFAVVIMLDYVIAFTALGLAGIFTGKKGNSGFGPAMGSCCVTLLRYLCHIISGIAVWGVYAPEGTPVWLYSVVYNGSYMIPETIITALAITLLMKTVNSKIPL